MCTVFFEVFSTVAAGMALSSSIILSGIYLASRSRGTGFLGIAAPSSTAGGSVGKLFSPWKVALESSLSVDENDARVMLRVPICGATELDPVLSKSFPEELDCEVDDLPKSLRQDEPPLLLDKILKLDVKESLDEKCLKDL